MIVPAPLHIVGLGPGDSQLLTFQAENILDSADCIAGYGLYLDFLPPRLKNGKKIIASGMRHERERCQKALECASAGLRTALVCSGDPGIYAMASLIVEMLEMEKALEGFPLEIIPGVPALCAAAARLGAPLGHDFACISLSDLLTPWESIEKRARCALAGDFVCVLYNPRSRGRQDHLAHILKLTSEWREASCPVALAKNIYRVGESIKLSSLENFNPDWADMLSLVIIGNSASRIIGKYMLTPRGYF